MPTNQVPPSGKRPIAAPPPPRQVYRPEALAAAFGKPKAPSEQAPPPSVAGVTAGRGQQGSAPAPQTDAQAEADQPADEIPFGSPEQVAKEKADAEAARKAAAAAAPSYLPVMNQARTIPPFDELTMLLFGKPGSGKTILAASNPGAYFLSLEPGQDFVRAARVQIGSWAEFQQHVVAIHKAKQEGKFAFHTAVIDIVDVLSGYCRDYICKKKNLTYPPESDFGKTWREVAEEWQKWMRALMRTVSVVFITHCNESPREITLANGLMQEVAVSHPTFAGGTGGGMGKYLDGIVNAMGHLRIKGNGRHAITFCKDAKTDAKDRTDILSKLGEIELLPDLRGNWAHIAKLYEAKAKEAGLGIKSIWNVNPGTAF